MDSKIKQKLLANIFPESIASISDFDTFPWHTDSKKNIDTYKIQSSQALMIDVFGYLSICKDKDEIINTVFNLKDSNWKITFEFTNDKLLNEKKSTQIDTIIEGNKNIILIECKFTENDGGTCSQTQKIKRLNKKQCTGNYQEQINPVNGITSSCSLSGKNISYWNYIPKIYDFSNQEDYIPCPFKGGHYQWMRNLCFAYSMQKSVNKKTTSYICYDDADFCPMKKKFDNEYLSNINKHVKSDFQFYIVTYQKIIETGIMISREDSNWTLLKKWVSDKEEKVRLLIK